MAAFTESALLPADKYKYNLHPSTTRNHLCVHYVNCKGWITSTAPNIVPYYAYFRKKVSISSGLLY